MLGPFSFLPHFAIMINIKTASDRKISETVLNIKRAKSYQTLRYFLNRYETQIGGNSHENI